MPVARIISSSVEDALKFADYLRPVFDTVEIAQPGRASKTAVDLEVNLELCTPEQAWKQIALAGEFAETEVFVAPGTLFAEAGQPPEGAGAAEIQPEAVDSAKMGLEDANRDLDAAVTQASAAAGIADGAKGTGASGPDCATVAPQQELNWLGRWWESLRQRLAVRALLREIREMEEQRRAAEQQRQRHMALQFERERRDKEMQQFAAAPVMERQAAEFPEWEQGREAPPAVSANQEEIQRCQAEEEEAIRRGIFVEQILKRRAQEQAAVTEPAPDRKAEPVESLPVAAEAFAEPEPLEAQPVSENGFAEAEAADLQPVTEVAFTEAEELAPVSWFNRKPVNRLRPAMALAGATSVLLTAVLVGYAYRRPASPLPASALQRSNVVQQAVPFGSAVVASPPLAPETDPAPEAEAPSTPMETASAADPVSEARPDHNGFRRVRVGKHEVDYVSDDVTVRHFIYPQRGSLVPHPAADIHITTSNGIKQISDLQ